MAAYQVSPVGAIDFGLHYPSSRAANPVGGTSEANPAVRAGGAQVRGASASNLHNGPVAAAQTTGAPETGRTAFSRTEKSAQTRQLVSAKPGSLPAASPSSTNMGMVLFDLQSGIRKAEALLQSLSHETLSAPARLIVAKAYSLEMQAQQEISRLQTQSVGPAREWFA